MKNLFPLLSLLLLGLLIGCQTSANDAPSEPAPLTKKNRNMFGHGIPRGLTINSSPVTPGYVLFCETNSASTYLINRQGEVVHKWKGNYGVANVYLNDDGSLFQMVYDVDFPVFAGGGEAGRIQKISWDGKILWDFEYANEKEHAHHDIHVMPNGNILSIAWEAKTLEECIQAGRKPDETPKAGLWPEKIVEIKPRGLRHGDIVWEWHSWDHIIQNNDPYLPNYGNPADHPELFDINIGSRLPPLITQDSMDILHAKGGQWRNQTADNRGSDFYHFNAINYNEELDQIAFSSQILDEIFIIDHSTTTEEAAGHTGGRWGKGGDILYRWGNPQNYSRGDSTHQQLFGQHDIRWVEAGKPGASNLTVYNNHIPGGPDSMAYSAVFEFKPPTDENGNYIIEDGEAFGPLEPHWKYMAPDTVSFYGSFISGAHRMKNGNTFINEGPKGRFFEVTPSGEIVWEYLNPYHGDLRKPNGDPFPAKPMTYIQFRSTFIGADHPAFVGKELRPIEPQPEVYVLENPKEEM